MTTSPDATGMPPTRTSRSAPAGCLSRTIALTVKAAQSRTFTVVDPKSQAVLPVDFTGIIPDTFVDDADVVVEGKRRDDGVFEATTLLAKCPSKYEAAK